MIGFTTTSVRSNVAIYDRDLLRDALADSFLNDNDEATDEEKQVYANYGVLEQDVDETLEEMIGELSPNSPLVVKMPDAGTRWRFEAELSVCDRTEGADCWLH